MSVSRIEAYLWSSGVTGKQDATQEITVIEPGPLSDTFTLVEGARVFGDLLTELAAQINASGTLGGTYSLTWDASAAAVTISATGVASFEVQFAGNFHKVLGFSAATGHTGSASYTGDVQALGRFDAVRVDCDVLTDGAIVKVIRSRHGRHRVIAWGNHDKFAARMKVPRSVAASFEDSYCCAGNRVRIYANASDTSAYSATNPDGYVDGWIVETSKPARLGGPGTFEAWYAQRLVVAVPR